MNYDSSREALYHPESKPVFVDIDHTPAFNARVFGFSLINAWWLSNAAHLAYYDVEELEPELRRVGLRLVDCFSKTSTQAYLAASDSYAILAFRGTESDDLADLKSDVDIRLGAFGDTARVHRGFLAALDEVWKELDGRLEEIAAQGLPIWFTGHSLGAALATLAAARRKPDALYTFGSPRVGDEGLVRLLDGLSVQRLVNCSDMAVTVPDHLLDYRHVGDLVFVTSGAGLHLNPPGWRVVYSKAVGTIRYAVSLPWFRREIVSARPFADHAIVNYTVALSKSIARDPDHRSGSR
jgi:hypothetical protein